MVPLGVAGTILLRPKPAEANIIIAIFEVGSYGMGSLLGAGLVMGLLAVGAVQAIDYGLHAVFGSGSSGSGGGGSSSQYSASYPSGWKAYTPPKPIEIRISFNPTDRIAGDVLRIRAIEHNILKNDGIVLPHGGRLMIEEDGTMRFADTKFRGYARMQNNGDLSVWTPEHQHVLSRSPREGKFHNLHHDSDGGRIALTSLLGEIKHA